MWIAWKSFLRAFHKAQMSSEFLSWRSEPWTKEYLIKRFYRQWHRCRAQPNLQSLKPKLGTINLRKTRFFLAWIQTIWNFPAEPSVGNCRGRQKFPRNRFAFRFGIAVVGGSGWRWLIGTLVGQKADKATSNDFRANHWEQKTFKNSSTFMFILHELAPLSNQLR